MIVGNGDIASVLTDREGFTFFASGVSNSQETRDSEYLREMELLMEQDQQTHLVYFSSLAIFYANNRYTAHKQIMESGIKNYFRRYTIVRIGNITWGDNPHTLINYLRAHPEAPIQDVYRYVVDEEEFLYWIGMIPAWSCEMNVTGRRMKVAQIVEEYVSERSHSYLLHS